MEIINYKSLKEKDDYFQTGSSVIYRPEDFDFVLSSLGDFMTNGFVFRGVNAAKYKLYNSAQRKFIENKLNIHYSSYQEFILDEINKFKTKNLNSLDEYLSKLDISQDNYLALLSIMRHCSLPTPCIDFTDNPLVALYFAFNECTNSSSSDIDDYVSIYFFSKKELPVFFMDFSIPIIESLLLRNILKHENNEPNLNNDIPFNLLFSLNIPFAFDITLNSFINFRTWNNANIKNQKGLLFLCTESYLPFEYLIKVILNANSSKNILGIKCINFHKSLKNHVIKWLDINQINQNSLFSNEPPFGLVFT